MKLLIYSYATRHKIMKSLTYSTFMLIFFLMTTTLVSGCAHVFSGTEIQSDLKAHDFELTATGNQIVKLSDYRGKLVLLYFGYTYCPDVCPATMSEISKAMKALKNKAQDVQVIMISVDPDRDTPEKLADYVHNFNPDFIGVTGSEEELQRIATLYGIYYEKEAGTVEQGYLVNHTATVMVIDREGYLRLVFPFGVPGKDMARDLSVLLRR